MMYESQRQILFDLFEQYIPTFRNMTMSKQHDIILYGYRIDNDDSLFTNTRLTLGVQIYIKHTKRFQDN